MISSLIRISRPINVIISIISVLITAFILKIDYFSTLVLITCLVVAGFTIFSNVINDIFDLKTDKINRPNKPLPKQKISIQNAVNFLIIELILCISITQQLNPLAKNIVYYIILPIIITYTPIFKSVPLLGNFLIGTTLGLVFLFSEASFLNQFGFMWIPALLATHLTILRELLKDIEDHEGDYKSGITTFPVCFGIQHSLNLFLFLTLILLAWAGFLPLYMELNPYYLPTFWLFFSPWIFIILYSLFWKKSKDYHTISNILKIATICGLGVIMTFGLEV